LVANKGLLLFLSALILRAVFSLRIRGGLWGFF
jgi:hypothetical protein